MTKHLEILSKMKSLCKVDNQTLSALSENRLTARQIASIYAGEKHMLTDDNLNLLSAALSKAYTFCQEKMDVELEPVLEEANS